MIVDDVVFVDELCCVDSVDVDTAVIVIICVVVVVVGFSPYYVMADRDDVVDEIVAWLCCQC